MTGQPATPSAEHKQEVPLWVRTTKKCTTKKRTTSEADDAAVALEDEVQADTVQVAVAAVAVGNEQSGEQSPTASCSFLPSELRSTATS